MRTWRILASVALIAFFSAAAQAAPEATRAVAVVHPTQGNQCRGTVWFTVDEGGLVVEARLEGLKPNSRHGFHIHQYGDCSSPDAKSAGDHYNPETHKHGGPDSPDRHAGDLGNVTSDAEGKADYRLVVRDLTINGTRNPVLGRAVIVHAGQDDLKSQPSGDSGARIGCGVIGLAGEPAEPAPPR
ncbi:MAG: superoxide dismutase family protein [Armatimonadetes bacterium]|nr:superoxide dismutase family protein [Armatimonadota bacterium]